MSAPIQYGGGKYGVHKYGSQQREFAYRVEILDSLGVRKHRFERQISNLSWEYNRIGGCGNGSFDLEFTEAAFFLAQAQDEVNIYIRNATGGSYTKWYAGFVDQISVSYGTSSIRARFSFKGYIQQLKRVFVASTFSSTEVSAIVTSILDNSVVPNTGVTYSAGDISSTSVTLTSIEFNQDALAAMQSLADAVGTREWGVGPDKKFFFKARSATKTFRFPLGGLISKYDFIDSFSEIVNSVRVEGDTVSGVLIVSTVQDTASQTKFGLRSKIVQDSSIKNTADATAVGNAILAESIDIKRRGSFTLQKNRFQYEATIPIGTISVQDRVLQRYGTFKYSERKYTFEITFQIEKIKHTITDNGLQTTIEFGNPQPNISNIITGIMGDINQLRQRDVA